MLIERYELALVSVQTASGRVGVPVVDGWVEVQLAVLRIPEAAERRAFFGALGSLVAVLRQHRPDLRWYFLHKAPGLKLRFRLGPPEVAPVEALLGDIQNWHVPFLRPSGLGSVFDQAELMPRMFREDAANLLSHAADRLVEAAQAERHCTAEDWAFFLIRLLEALDLDAWLAHEALSRLLRLRSVALGTFDDAPAEPLLDPSAILKGMPGPCTAGFPASVSLLQTINLMLNMWGVDAGAQHRIFDVACMATRPPLMEPSHG